jgi:hypothetical protein
MNHPVTIVCLGKYWEVFKDFLETSESNLSDYPKILIRDGKDIPSDLLGGRWTVIDGPKEFAMAGNGNLGLQAVPPDSDILYCGDDVRFIQADTIEKLQEIAYKDSAIGILSPRIIGRGSPSQVTPMAEISEVPPLEMWFPCIYIKREVIDKVGYLDEQFNKFGSDDLDYCIRTKQAGYKLCVAANVAVKHEASPEGGPTTFIKKIGIQKWQIQQTEALGKLIKKYGVAPVVMDKIIRSGDISYLDKRPSEFQKRVSAGEQPPYDECLQFLKTRKLFIGTPAYAGNCHVTYVNSLIGITNIIRDMSLQLSEPIKFQIHFIHNESLITRARNTIVDQFLSSDATDFFWIDADIGFNPQDIITFMMYDEDVICVPVVRKNLRVDRVVTSVKREFVKEVAQVVSEKDVWTSSELADVLNQGLNHNGHNVVDLEKMMGEVVLNFPPDKMPPRINLGSLYEIMDGGSGLMRIKRETFLTIMEKFPERRAMQLAGETGGRKPVYMFFQAEPDYTIADQEIPDYISEDYSFCRLARKAGLKVWVAPWAQTEHAGTYLFKGDPEFIAKSGGYLR